jgi:hypothetical protein
MHSPRRRSPILARTTPERMKEIQKINGRSYDPSRILFPNGSPERGRFEVAKPGSAFLRALRIGCRGRDQDSNPDDRRRVTPSRNEIIYTTRRRIAQGLGTTIGAEARWNLRSQQNCGLPWSRRRSFPRGEQYVSPGSGSPGRVAPEIPLPIPNRLPTARDSEPGR